MCVQGRWEDSLSVLKRCRSIARTAEEKVEVLVAEGHVLISLCRWDEGVEIWEHAVAMVPEGRRSSVLQRVQLGRSRLFHSLGHYRLAAQWAERAAAGAPVTATRVMAIHGQALLACMSGEYDEADRLSEECRRLAEAYHFTFMDVPCLLVAADVSRGRWDFRTAVAKCTEAGRRAVAADDSEGVYWAEQILGDICRCNRNAARALEHHRKAEEIVGKSRLSPSEKARATTGRGMDLVLLGQEEQALAVLEESVRESRRWGMKGSLVPSLFYSGWLYAKAEREQEAGRSLGEAIRIAEAHNHLHFFNQEARIAIPIFALCERFGVGGFLREKIVPQLPRRLQTHFRTLAAGDVYPTDARLGSPQRGLSAQASVTAVSDPVGDQTSDDPSALVGLLTEREQQILEAVAGGMPNKVIGARLFISEKTVKTHTNHIFRKLGVTSRLQAALVYQSYQRALAAGSAARNRLP